MAKRRSSKKGMALVKMPTEKCIPVYGSGASARILRIETGRLLSQMNMRLYRQAMNYKVKISLADLHSDKGNNFQIFTLPNTWLTNGAVKHAYRMYRAAMKDELAQSGGKTGKWHDFSINANDVDGTETASAQKKHQKKTQKGIKKDVKKTYRMTKRVF